MSISVIIKKAQWTWQKMVASSVAIGDTPDVPRKEKRVSDILNDVSLPAAEPVACSLSTHSGVYYAHLYVPGHNEPMLVALHGVTTDSQAALALESFARLRSGETLDEVPVAA